MKSALSCSGRCSDGIQENHDDDAFAGQPARLADHALSAGDEGRDQSLRYTLGPLYENGLLHRLAPKLGEKAISAIADGTMDALTGALNADEGERLSGAVKGGVGGLFKNGVSLGGKAYVDKLELDVLHNTPWADKLVSDHLIPLAVGWGYDQGKKQFEEPYQTPTLKDVTEDQNLDGGVPAAVLQSAPSSSPLDLYHSRMSSGVGSDCRAPLIYHWCKLFAQS